MYVVRPEVTDEGLRALMGRVGDTIAQIGASIDLHEVWDRRPLAYPIDGCTRGIYCICYFNAESRALEDLRRELELEEGILRHMIVVANPQAIWRPVGPEEAAPAQGEEPAEVEEEEGGEAAEAEREAPAEEPEGEDVAEEAGEAEEQAGDEGEPETTPDE